MTTKIKSLDLSYIYEISDHDRDFIKELLVTFLKITPISLDEIKKAQAKNNWKEVGRIAHKVKPTIMLIGDELLSKKIKTIEQEAKQEANLDLLPNLILELDELCKHTISEIKELVETDRF